MRFKRRALKGDATDPVLARKVWAISEEQTGISPAPSTVAGVKAARADSRATTM
jgi:hypothetical protein